MQQVKYNQIIEEGTELSNQLSTQKRGISS